MKVGFSDRTLRLAEARAASVGEPVHPPQQTLLCSSPRQPAPIRVPPNTPDRLSMWAGASPLARHPLNRPSWRVLAPTIRKGPATCSPRGPNSMATAMTYWRSPKLQPASPTTRRRTASHRPLMRSFAAGPSKRHPRVFGDSALPFPRRAPQLSPPPQLRNLLQSLPLQPTKLLIHSPAKRQKSSQRHHYTAGRSLIGQHHQPHLRSITCHSASPRLAAHLHVIRLALGYLLDAYPSFWVHPKRTLGPIFSLFPRLFV